MSRNGIYIRVLLVVVAVAVLVSFLGRQARTESRDAWVPTTFNPVGAGSLALYETLADLHWPVARWREPLSRLARQGTGNALVIARARDGYRVAFTGQEAALLAGWVSQGNTLLLLGPMDKWADTCLLLGRFGFPSLKEESDAGGLFPTWSLQREKQVSLAPAPGENGTLVIPEGPALPAALPHDAQILWADAGQAYAAQFPYGKGAVVCVSSARFLSNQYLGRGDDLAIALRLFAPGAQVPRHLFFEETHHGYTQTFALSRLTGHPGVRLAFLLALLGGATFLGSAFVRFGPVQPLEHRPGRSSLEFVDSIAELHQRADLRNETIRYLFDETHRQVLRRLNLPRTAPHEIIASRLRQSHPDLPGWKKLAQRFDSQDYVAGLPPGGWLRVARELIQIKTALA